MRGIFYWKETSNRSDSVASGNRKLVAAKGSLKKELLELDIADEIAKRGKFLLSAPLPEDVSEAARRTALKALSQLKTQIYSPEGRTAGRISRCGSGILFSMRLECGTAIRRLPAI